MSDSNHWLNLVNRLFGSKVSFRTQGEDGTNFTFVVKDVAGMELFKAQESALRQACGVNCKIYYTSTMEQKIVKGPKGLETHHIEAVEVQVTDAQLPTPEPEVIS